MRCLAVLAILTVVACGQDSSQLHSKRPVEPPALGLHWAKGEAHAKPRPGSPDMLWHNGAIMTSAVT